MTDTKDAEQKGATEQSVSQQASGGIRARRAFMTKFLIGGDAIEWINKNVVAAGKGTKKIVGRFYGIATGFEVKENEFQGKILRSTVIYGQFEYESTVTGELGQATSAYLPDAYAGQVAAQFEADPSVKMVQVDIDLGLEATSKTIPYEWLVANHGGEENGVLQRLRKMRRPGQRAQLSPSTEKPAELTQQGAPEEVEPGEVEGEKSDGARAEKPAPARGSKK